MSTGSSRLLESPEGDFHLRHLTMRDAGEYFDRFDANRSYIAGYDHGFAKAFPTITAVTKELAPYNAVERRHFAIMQDGIFAGSVGMHLKPAGKAELFCWIDSNHAGEGLATRAGSLLASYAFKEVYVSEMEAIIAETNIPSQRVAKKIGFSFAGIHENDMHFSLQPNNFTSSG